MRVKDMVQRLTGPSTPFSAVVQLTSLIRRGVTAAEELCNKGYNSGDYHTHQDIGCAIVKHLMLTPMS